MKLSLVLILFSTVATACPAASKVPTEAARALFQNAEVVEYVCVENKRCSQEEFAAYLDVKEISLGATPRKKVDAILVEPSRKGRQFFSAVFVKNAGKFALVFSPDTTLSGIKAMPEIKSDMRVLRGTERESAESWKEIDYGFDLKSKQYSEIRTRCYQQKNGKPASTKCDS